MSRTVVALTNNFTEFEKDDVILTVGILENLVEITTSLNEVSNKDHVKPPRAYDVDNVIPTSTT